MYAVYAKSSVGKEEAHIHVCETERDAQAWIDRAFGNTKAGLSFEVRPITQPKPEYNFNGA